MLKKLAVIIVSFDFPKVEGVRNRESTILKNGHFWGPDFGGPKTVDFSTFSRGPKNCGLLRGLKNCGLFDLFGGPKNESTISASREIFGKSWGL